MASGMVPITNAVAAIPEFVDERCGVLARTESYEGIAKGIEILFKNPGRFSELSYARLRRG